MPVAISINFNKNTKLEISFNTTVSNKIVSVKRVFRLILRISVLQMLLILSWIREKMHNVHNELH